MNREALIHKEGWLLMVGQDSNLLNRHTVKAVLDGGLLLKDIVCLVDTMNQVDWIIHPMAWLLIRTYWQWRRA